MIHTSESTDKRRLFAMMILLCTFLLMIPSYGLSHSGGTDSKGGHYDHSTGEYHYHHGHGPHQHPNGVCPYGDYGQGGSGTRNAPKATARPTDKTVDQQLFQILFGETAKPTTRPDNRQTAKPTSRPGTVQTPKPTTRPATRQTEKPVKNPSKTTEKAASSASQFLTRVIQSPTAIFEEGQFPWTMAGAAGLGLGIRARVRRNRRVREERRRQEEAAERRAERIRYYQNHSIRSICSIPPGAEIGQDGLPISDHISNERWGAGYTRYVSKSGSCYHRKGCYGGIPIHVTRIHNYYRPCTVCKPDPIPEIPWLDAYRRAKQECNQLGITPLDDIEVVNKNL